MEIRVCHTYTCKEYDHIQYSSNGLKRQTELIHFQLVLCLKIVILATVKTFYWNTVHSHA